MALRKFSNPRPHTKRQQQAKAKSAKKKTPASRKLSHSVPIITLRWGNKKLEIETFVNLLASAVKLITEFVSFIIMILALLIAFHSRTPNPQLAPSDTPVAISTYTFTTIPTWTSGPTTLSSLTTAFQPTSTPSPYWTSTATATPLPKNLSTESLPPKPTHDAEPSPTSTKILLSTITPIPTQSSTITSTSIIVVITTNTPTSTPLPSFTSTTSNTPTDTSTPTDTPSITTTATSSHTPTYTPPATPTPTSTASLTPVSADTRTLSATPTPSDVPTLLGYTPTYVPTFTPTPIYTVAPTWTQTPTVTTTPLPIYTLIPTPTITEDAQGCSPGYWKNHLDSWMQTGYSPTDDFDAVFEVNMFNPDITLEQALNTQGGGDAKLARQGVAALLNAAYPNLRYPLTVYQVITLVKAKDADTFAEFNELICPLK